MAPPDHASLSAQWKALDLARAQLNADRAHLEFERGLIAELSWASLDAFLTSIQKRQRQIERNMTLFHALLLPPPPPPVNDGALPTQPSPSLPPALLSFATPVVAQWAGWEIRPRERPGPRDLREPERTARAFLDQGMPLFQVLTHYLSKEPGARARLLQASAPRRSEAPRRSRERERRKQAALAAFLEDGASLERIASTLRVRVRTVREYLSEEPGARARLLQASAQRRREANPHPLMATRQTRGRERRKQAALAAYLEDGASVEQIASTLRVSPQRVRQYLSEEPGAHARLLQVSAHRRSEAARLAACG